MEYVEALKSSGDSESSDDEEEGCEVVMEL